MVCFRFIFYFFFCVNLSFPWVTADFFSFLFLYIEKEQYLRSTKITREYKTRTLVLFYWKFSTVTWLSVSFARTTALYMGTIRARLMILIDVCFTLLLVNLSNGALYT